MFLVFNFEKIVTYIISVIIIVGLFCFANSMSIVNSKDVYKYNNITNFENNSKN